MTDDDARGRQNFTLRGRDLSIAPADICTATRDVPPTTPIDGRYKYFVELHRRRFPNQASPSAGHVAAVGLRGKRRASDSLETRFRHHRGPRIGTPAARRSRKRRGRSAFVRVIEPHCSRYVTAVP